MPLYQYQSLNRRGATVNGTLDASSLQAVKEILQGQGLMPITISEVAYDKQGSSWKSMLFDKPIEPKMVVQFTKQLAVLLKASVPLLQAIELLIEQMEGRFRRILIKIKDGIKGGESFAKELSKYPKVFTNVYVQLVRSGEASGKLDTILFRLTDYLERAEETKKRIKKAIAYPLLLISFAILVVVGMLVGMVPLMSKIFKSLGKELPAPTKIMIAMSDFVRDYGIVALVTVIVFAAFFLYWRSTAKGKYHIDAIVLKLPILSSFSRTKAVVQFSKTLGMLLESGVNLSDALDIVCNIVDNKVLTKKLNQARDNIIKEGKIAKYLKDTGIFPSIATYMISTGEQSGKLAEMLLTVGDDYDTELRERTDGLTAKIAPLMTIIIGVFVLFIVLSMMLPMMDMGDMAGM